MEHVGQSKFELSLKFGATVNELYPFEWTQILQLQFSSSQVNFEFWAGPDDFQVVQRQFQ